MMLNLVLLIFCVGYLTITFEHHLKISKSAMALVTGGLCWCVYSVLSPDKALVLDHLSHHLGEIAGIVFFLLGAMTIVELIDMHDGFSIIAVRLTATRKRYVLWIIGIAAFFLSAFLDNLTTTIVILSLLQKIIKDNQDRMLLVGITIIAANAGGAWSPIGDVTTTMLWIGGQLSTEVIIVKLILPSIACLVVPLTVASFFMNGDFERDEVLNSPLVGYKKQFIVFASGLLVLMLVPVFKILTHLPPFMGMLLGLGILWLFTELLHRNQTETRKQLFSVTSALRRIDTDSILFFFGILLAISALQSSGILAYFSTWLTAYFQNEHVLILSVGLLSAVVDNVPLVAALQGMFTLQQYPMDHGFWQFLAYCTGTGGSLLIIGSAAGIAAMGIEKIEFFWYIKRISFLAALGYFAGAFVFIFQG